MIDDMTAHAHVRTVGPRSTHVSTHSGESSGKDSELEIQWDASTRIGRGKSSRMALDATNPREERSRAATALMISPFLSSGNQIRSAWFIGYSSSDVAIAFHQVS